MKEMCQVVFLHGRGDTGHNMLPVARNPVGHARQ